MNHEKQRLADIRRRLENARRQLDAQDEAIDVLNAFVSEHEVMDLAKALDDVMSRSPSKAITLTATLA